MEAVKSILIKKYCLEKLRFDFMGYPFNYLEELTYHHLLIPASFYASENLGEGRYLWNGALLHRLTSHDYLHIIEKFDEERFYAITSEILDMKIKGKLSLENIKVIDDILNSFEREYLNKKIKSHYIVKEEYLKRVLKRVS